VEEFLTFTVRAGGSEQIAKYEIKITIFIGISIISHDP
jgi:hypothetical protein